MKTVDFKTFTVTTDGETKQFFEEGLIHNELEMLSIVDARKHFEKLYNEDPFFYHDPKDIEYRLDLYQKLETFSMNRIDFDRLEKSIISHSHGECQPVWLHWDGAITEIVGDDFDTPYNQELNPVVAVFKSLQCDVKLDKGTSDSLQYHWEYLIKQSIQSKMIEIEAEHIR